MSNLRQWIMEDYQERVRLNPEIPDELKRALKTHERVPIFVDNLLGEIKKFPKNHKMNRHMLKQLVYGMTDLFCKNAQTVAENRYKSDIQKELERQAAADPFKLDNQGNGVIEEMGVEVHDGKDSRG